MRLSQGLLARTRELWPIFLVAVGVALASTLAGSVLDRVHRIDAEELTAAVATAVQGPDNTQVIDFKDWGVRLTAPLGADLSSVQYTTRSGDAVGVSSTTLAPLGANCLASRNALGVFRRAPLGSYASSKHGGSIEYFAGSVGQYEYTYQLPQNACTDTEAGHTVVNRETSALIQSLDSLAPSAN